MRPSSYRARLIVMHRLAASPLIVLSAYARTIARAAAGAGVSFIAAQEFLGLGVSAPSQLPVRFDARRPMAAPLFFGRFQGLPP
jgi:hypothetical protein